MPLTLDHADLPALSHGYSLLGSGGAGEPTISALMVEHTAQWPVIVHGVDELDDATPCVAVAIMGSTIMVAEKLPGLQPYAGVIGALERWIGARAGAVCNAEGAGINGVAALLPADGRVIVDADLVGRAFPDLDQLTLLVDGLPGLVVACETGGGVTLVADARPADVERVLRTATTCSGGWSTFGVGGFTVGDLRRHAVLDGTERALGLGRGYLACAETTDPAAIAEQLGAQLLGAGRVVDIRQEPGPRELTTFQLAGSDGAVLRLVAGSEFLAVLRDGQLLVSSPVIVAVLDRVSHRILQVPDVTHAMDLMLLAIPAPSWWVEQPHRLRESRPSRWGFEGLDAL
ncbi:S-methyl thiohydantoin desulfurase domain-containing protein [Flexivirga lutea]